MSLRQVNRTWVVATCLSLLGSSSVVRADASGIASDDFNKCELNASLWTVVDPVGGSGVSVTGVGTDNADLVIAVSAGPSHDEGNVVRVMQPANNTDFEVQVKLDSQFTSGYQMYGIYVEQDATHGLYYELAYDGTGVFLYSATIAGGPATSQGLQFIAKSEPFWLSLNRTGDLWTLRYSTNGQTWSDFVAFTFSLTVARVGPCAGNYAPATARPSRRRLITFSTQPCRSPRRMVFPAGLTGYALARTVTGQGSITVDPDQAAYYCSESVSVTAVPTGGWSFNGWSGDATGNNNPIQLVMSANRSIAAYFVQNTTPPSQITVWYGSTQEFGKIGTPQPTVDILGNVSNSGQVTSLSYSLNGGPAMPLSMGPDTRRLAEAGDFDAELALADLLAGANTLVLTAVDNQNRTASATVTVINSSGPTWPLPYNIDWTSASSINSVAQVTDGQWVIDGGALRPTVLSYDRLVAIGDQTWQDYEATVPLTVHSIDPAGNAAPSYGPGVGILLRWPGHSVDGHQPREGVYPLGAIGMYRWPAGGTEEFELFGNNGVLLAHTTDPLTLEVGYIFKMRVQTLVTGTQYQFKWWQASGTEPQSWQLTGQQSNDPGHGSILLLAHYVDVSFGNVAVTPLNVGGLQVTISPSEAATAGGQWRRVGTTTWHNSGDTETNVPTGSQTVEFKDVTGWSTPGNADVTIVDGETATAGGTYIRQTGSLQVTLSPQDAVTAGAQWNVDGGAWQDSGAVLAGLTVGSHTISFKDIAVWYRPGDQVVDIAFNTTATASGTYTNVPQTGSLQVTISPQDAITAGAQWKVDGGAWQDSGTILSGLSAGSHTVTFKDVNGWTTPTDQPLNIVANQTATAGGTYILAPQTGSLQVTISPQDAITAGAQWKVDGGAWQDSGTIVSGLSAGSHTVTFKDVNGWTTPTDQPLNIVANQTATAGGTYLLASQTGSLQVTISPQDAITAGAQWSVDGGAWQDSGTIVSGLSAGNHTVAFKDVSGWTTPSNQAADIVSNQTATATGTYTVVSTGGGGGGGAPPPDLTKDSETTDNSGAAALDVLLGNDGGKVQIEGAPQGVQIKAQISGTSGHGFAGIGVGDGTGAMPEVITIESGLIPGTFTATIQICYDPAKLAAAGLAAADLVMHFWDSTAGKWVLAGSHNVGESAPTGLVGDYGWNGNCIWVVVNHLSEYLGADECPNDPNKSVPGLCGCGVPDTDSDGDGVPDCTDQCPQDPNKTTPGVCGCGVADIDSDGDGVLDCLDQCPGTPAGTTVDAQGCPVVDSTTPAQPTPDVPEEPQTVTPSQPSFSLCGAGAVETMLMSILGLMFLRTTGWGTNPVAPRLGSRRMRRNWRGW